jgi:hypothetical protein
MRSVMLLTFAEKDFRKCLLYCVWHLLMIEWYKKGQKTDYENLVHVYLYPSHVGLGLFTVVF